MKHAYLIIAHNEFELLKLLIDRIDDARNDIYIHIDQKTNTEGLELRAHQSKLFVLQKRIDARWGDYSLVEVELSLFREAFNNGEYEYYHLLSGVDLPIKSQNYIHDFCKIHKGTEFIGIAQNVSVKELKWRSQHWFIFAHDFKSNNILKKVLRTILARLQTVLGYKRTEMQIKKGAQWCSITNSFVSYILKNEELIYKSFNHTYCPDELFIQTLCWNSPFRKKLYSTSDEFEGCMRYINWIDGCLQPITIDDVALMRETDRWFARKFTIANKEVVAQILKLSIQ